MQNEFANVDKHQLYTSTKEIEINRPSFSIGGYDVRFSKTKQSCGCVETSVTGMAIAFLLLLEKGKKNFFSTFHSVHLSKRNCRRLWSLAKTVKPPNPSWEKEKKHLWPASNLMPPVVFISLSASSHLFGRLGGPLSERKEGGEDVQLWLRYFLFVVCVSICEMAFSNCKEKESQQLIDWSKYYYYFV